MEFASIFFFFLIYLVPFMRARNQVNKGQDPFNTMLELKYILAE